MIRIIYVIVVLFIIVQAYILLHPTFGGKPKGKYLEAINNSPNYKNGVFHNLEVTPTMENKGEGLLWPTMKKAIFGFENDKPSSPLETIKFNKDSLLTSSNKVKFSWFGHSTLIFNIDGKVVITDPVFSESASPIPFTNKSFDFENSYSVADLPDIDIVLISHDHYDHLDMKTIKKIDSKTKRFIVPLGVGAHLLRWGIDEDKIMIADWGDSFNYQGIEFVSTPARHFSGRLGRDKTLWCSWVIRTDKHSLFFDGDSGYGKHFKTIGESYGPFDMTFMECGQYNKMWSKIHSMPEEAVAANIDLKGKSMFPIHWSKFRLSVHEWTEPIDRVSKEAERLGVHLVTTKIGEVHKIDNK